MLSKGEVSGVYQKRARNYNFTVQLYHLLGFRMDSYREEAIQSLRLKAGDTVVDIGCGTGANFPLLLERVGKNGRIIGVDFTDAMLAKARERVEQKQWCNVELVHNDAASYQFPAKVDGVISSFAIIYVPEFDDVIRNGSRSLVAGGRLAYWTSSCLTGGFRVSPHSPFSILGPGVSRRKWHRDIRGSRFPVI